MNKNLLSLLVMILVFTSCEDFRKKNRPDYRLKLVTNAPVAINERLTVHVENVLADNTYQLTLPNGQVYPYSSIEINNVTLEHGGWYKVKATAADYTSTQDSVYVKILPAAIPCSPAVNKLTCPLKFNMTFNEVVQGQSGSSYFVRGKSTFGNFTVWFDHPEKPVSAATYLSSYNISTPYRGRAMAYVTSTYGGQSYDYFIESGQQIHVSEENGTFFITLCELALVGGQNGELVTTRIEF